MKLVPAYVQHSDNLPVKSVGDKTFEKECITASSISSTIQRESQTPLTAQKRYDCSRTRPDGYGMASLLRDTFTDRGTAPASPVAASLQSTAPLQSMMP